jgi:hypothetical protein
VSQAIGTAPRPRRVHQPVALPIAEDQRIEVPAAESVSTDHELLGPIDAHLPLRAGALPRLIGAVEALGDDPLQPLLADGVDQVSETGVELRASRIGSVRRERTWRRSSSRLAVWYMGGLREISRTPQYRMQHPANQFG